MVARTWPVLQSFEKDQTRQNFVINQISAGLTELSSTGGAGITALTGDVTATGPGSVPATVLTFGASGASHRRGFVPDPGATAGIGRYLREDATWAFQRETLTANRDIYVTTTGNDANPGTIGSPVLTIQRALFLAYGTLDLSGFNVTIHVGTGTFSAATNNILAPQVGAGTIMMTGNGPTNTILSTTGTTLNVVRNAVITLDNLKVQTTGAACLVAQQSGIILGSQLGGSTPNLAFGGATFSHMYTASFGTIFLLATPYSIDADAPNHMNANGNGYISIAGTGSGAGLNAITIASARAFSNSFATASNIGYIEASFTNYTGAGVAGTTGQKYSSIYNSVIATAGAGAMPGSIAGSATVGGIYY